MKITFQQQITLQDVFHLAGDQIYPLIFFLAACRKQLQVLKNK